MQIRFQYDGAWHKRWNYLVGGIHEVHLIIRVLSKLLVHSSTAEHHNPAIEHRDSEYRTSVLRQKVPQHMAQLDSVNIAYLGVPFLEHFTRIEEELYRAPIG